MSKEAMKLALEALMRSRKAVSGDLDLAGCAYGKNDPDGHRYDDAKQALVTLDKAITAMREALAEQPAPPPECQTEAEKTAYAFGWFKALESVRKRPAEQEPMTTQTEADRLANQLDYHREYDLGVTHTGIDEQAAAELRRQQAEIERLNEALAEQTAREPLTDEQWQSIADTLGCIITRGQKDAIEAKLREKNQ